MRHLLRDLIVALRGFRRQKGLFVLATLTLAMGMGLTTAMFGITNGLLLNALPFDEGDRIVSIIRSRPNLATFLQTVPTRDYAAWQEQQTSFEELAAYTIATYNVSGGEQPERLVGAGMTASAFRTLRVAPLLGRTFVADDEVAGAPRTVLLAHALWHDRFDGDSSVVGRTMRVDGHDATIVGVMPEGFEFPFAQRLWLPLQLDPLTAQPGEGELRVFGRLNDGVAARAAEAEFGALAANLAVQFPETNEGFTIAVRPYVEQFVGAQAKPLLFMMLGLVFTVLLIACANVANLLLARAAAQQREIAIRTALGAVRRRLVVGQLVQVFPLALAGGALGFLVAQAGIGAFYRSITGQVKPFWLEARVEPEVLLFTGVLMLVATVVASVLPALRATKTDVADVLSDEARGSTGVRLGRISRWLVTAELAGSTALLVGAGLMVKGVINLVEFDYAFTTENIFTASVTTGDGDFESQDGQLQFLEDLEARLTGMPGVVAAGVATELPVLGVAQAPYEADGVTYASERDRPSTRVITASPGMFDVFELPLREGRLFTTSDRETSPFVAVANESFVQREFAGASPLGKRIRLRTATGAGEWITIVGVVADAYLAENLSTAAPAAIYLPLRQPDAAAGTAGVFAMNIVARTQGEPTAITADVREVIATLNPDIPLSGEGAFDRVLAQAYLGFVAIGSTFALFGLMALFLAAVGLHGVMSFSARRRTREIGIRMAFGAHTRNVFFLVMREAGKQLGIGLGVGLVASLGLANALQFILTDVPSLQPGIMAAVALVLATVAFVASAVPAIRASRVAPTVAIGGRA